MNWQSIQNYLTQINPLVFLAALAALVVLIAIFPRKKSAKVASEKVDSDEEPTITLLPRYRNGFWLSTAESRIWITILVIGIGLIVGSAVWGLLSWLTGTGITPLLIPGIALMFLGDLGEGPEVEIDKDHVGLVTVFGTRFRFWLLRIYLEEGRHRLPSKRLIGISGSGLRHPRTPGEEKGQVLVARYPIRLEAKDGDARLENLAYDDVPVGAVVVTTVATTDPSRYARQDDPMLETTARHKASFRAGLQLVNAEDAGTIKSLLARMMEGWKGMVVFTRKGEDNFQKRSILQSPVGTYLFVAIEPGAEITEEMKTEFLAEMKTQADPTMWTAAGGDDATVEILQVADSLLPVLHQNGLAVSNTSVEDIDLPEAATAAATQELIEIKEAAAQVRSATTAAKTRKIIADGTADGAPISPETAAVLAHRQDGHEGGQVLVVPGLEQLGANLAKLIDRKAA